MSSSQTIDESLNRTVLSSSAPSQAGHSERYLQQSLSTESSPPFSSSEGMLPKSALLLRQNPINFETPNSKVSVFFDECNREVISVVSGLAAHGGSNNSHKTSLVFQSACSTTDSQRIEFSMPIDRRILSIKLNPTREVLAYHVEKNVVEFVNVLRTTDDDTGQLTCKLEDKRYAQVSRAKNSKLIGFVWVSSVELVIVTDMSVEYHHVEASRRRVRFVKSFQSPTNWFVYQPRVPIPSTSNTGEGNHLSNPVLMVSMGSLGNLMQPYMIAQKQLVQLQRFEVEGNWYGKERVELFERSITIANIYGYVRLLVLQHELLNVKSKGAQILVYTVDHESGLTSKTHTLDLDVSGKFAINILDNLVVAHDQPSRSSFIFDIMIESTEKSDCPKHFVSLTNGQPIELHDGENRSVDMYSLNWVFFQPNFIIDARKGSLFTLHLNLDAMGRMIEDGVILLNFLAYRKNSELIILDKCKKLVSKSLEAVKTSREKTMISGAPLADVSSIFEVLARLVQPAPELDRKSSGRNKHTTVLIDKPARQQTSTSAKFTVTIAQEDVQRTVFRQLDAIDSDDPAQMHFVSSTLLEFIFITRLQGKTIEFCIYEQLIKCLIRGDKFYQLVQLIRSSILIDSKQLACLLLSLGSQYKPAIQLALDMLRRLDCFTNLVDSLSLSGGTGEVQTTHQQNSETTSRPSSTLNQSIEVE